MTKKTAIHAILLFLMMVVAIPVTKVHAIANSYPIQLSEQDKSLTDALSSNEAYFHIPSYWQVEHAAIVLDYSATPIAKQDQSSVTLLINGTPFHSFRPASDGAGKSLEVSIPKDLLVEGSNRLTVQGDLRTFENELVCIPNENQDDWLNIHKTTAVHVQYASVPLDGTIRDFYERFVGMDTMSNRQSVVAAPLASDNAELEAAAYAITGFSKGGISKNEPIALMPFTENGWTSKPYVAVVSLLDHLPDAIRQQLGDQDLRQTAVVQLVHLGEQHVLAVTSEDPSLLVKAGRLLANEELVSQMDRGKAIVTADTNVDTAAVQINRSQQLTETGDTLTGARHQARTYYVSLPSNRAISDASKIKLDFRYARNLDFSRSMVTLLVNDRPIGSKKLTEELADGDSLTLPIPKNMNISGNFTVTAAFDLEIESDYCQENSANMPWAYITSDSVLQLNTKDRTDLLFDNYPYPFLRDGIFNHVAVVLPKAKDALTYEAVSNVFTLLGQYAEGNVGEVRFYDEDEQDAPWRGSNVIAIGSYRNNGFIREANDSFYFQYNADGSALISNEKMSIDPEYGSRLGALQLMSSPYEDGFAMLAVTGADSEYAAMASRLISLERDKWKLSGDAVLTDRDGTVSAYRFKLEAEAEPDKGLEQVLQRTDLITFMMASILVISLVLVSLLLLIRKYRKNGGNRG